MDVLGSTDAFCSACGLDNEADFEKLCVITLTTLSIEAPGFYKKQGYNVAATIDCEPPGLVRYYMMKNL
jgi:hypothetical protein